MTNHFDDRIQNIDGGFYLPYDQERFAYFSDSGESKFVFVQKDDEFEIEQCQIFTFNFTGLYYKKEEDKPLTLTIIHSLRMEKVPINIISYCFIRFLAAHGYTNIISPSFSFIRQYIYSIFSQDQRLQNKYFQCSVSDIQISGDIEDNSPLAEWKLIPCLIYYSFFPNVKEKILKNTQLISASENLCFLFFSMIVSHYQSQIKEMTFSYQSQDLFDVFYDSDDVLGPYAHVLTYLLTSNKYSKTVELYKYKDKHHQSQFAHKTNQFLSLLSNKSHPQIDYLLPSLFTVLSPGTILSCLQQNPQTLVIHHQAYKEYKRVLDLYNDKKSAKALAKFIIDADETEAQKQEKKEATGKLKKFDSNLSNLIRTLRKQYIDNLNFSHLLDGITQKFNKKGYLSNLRLICSHLDTLQKERIQLILNKRKGTYDSQLKIQYYNTLKIFITFLEDYEQSKSLEFAAAILFLRYLDQELDPKIITLSISLQFLQSFCQEAKPDSIFLVDSFFNDRYFKPILGVFKPTRKEEPDPVDYTELQKEVDKEYASPEIISQFNNEPEQHQYEQNGEQKNDKKCTIY